MSAWPGSLRTWEPKGRERVYHDQPNLIHPPSCRIFDRLQSFQNHVKAVQSPGSPIFLNHHPRIHHRTPAPLSICTTNMHKIDASFIPWWTAPLKRESRIRSAVIRPSCPEKSNACTSASFFGSHRLKYLRVPISSCQAPERHLSFDLYDPPAPGLSSQLS